MLLASVPQFGPQKFKELWEAGVSPGVVLADPKQLPTGGKRGEQFRTAIRTHTGRERDEVRRRAERQIDAATRLGATILTYDHPAYPPVLMRSNYPVPYLFCRGKRGVVKSTRTVACVGSRGIRTPYDGLHRRFVEVACGEGCVVVSWFALGADSVGHRAAVDAGGATVGVMPGGLDRVFPPENKELWSRVVDEGGGAVVSEAAFGTRASSLLLRRRNRLIVALARGVLVGQSAAKGGAMNAFRFAVEQRKPSATFAPDESDATSGNGSIGAAGGTVFPREPDDDAYRRWLRELSSST